MWKKMMFRYIYNKLENVYSHDELNIIFNNSIIQYIDIDLILNHIGLNFFIPVGEALQAYIFDFEIVPNALDEKYHAWKDKNEISATYVLETYIINYTSR